MDSKLWRGGERNFKRRGQARKLEDLHVIKRSLSKGRSFPRRSKDLILPATEWESQVACLREERGEMFDEEGGTAKHAKREKKKGWRLI